MFLDFDAMVALMTRYGVPVVSVAHRGLREDVITWAIAHAADPAIVDDSLPPLPDNAGALHAPCTLPIQTHTLVCRVPWAGISGHGDVW